MFLNGTAMTGQRHHGAVSGATLLGPARTAPRYRFIAVRDEFPGLLAVTERGRSIEGELYELSGEILFGTLLPGEPAELDLSTVELDDGQTVHAMELRPDRLVPGDKVVDIADLGGWRNYQAWLAANEILPALLGLDPHRRAADR